MVYLLMKFINTPLSLFTYYKIHLPHGWSEKLNLFEIEMEMLVGIIQYLK